METSSMMIPGLGTPTPSSEYCGTDRELLLDILKSISRLEGMIMMQGNKPAASQGIGIPPYVPSGQLDLPPVMF